MPHKPLAAGTSLYALAVLDVPGMPEGRPALLLGDAGERAAAAAAEVVAEIPPQACDHVTACLPLQSLTPPTSPLQSSIPHCYPCRSPFGRSVHPHRASARAGDCGPGGSH